MLFTDIEEGIDAVVAVACSSRRGPSSSRASHPLIEIGELEIFRTAPGQARRRRRRESSQP